MKSNSDLITWRWYNMKTGVPENDIFTDSGPTEHAIDNAHSRGFGAEFLRDGCWHILDKYHSASRKKPDPTKPHTEHKEKEDLEKHIEGCRQITSDLDTVLRQTDIREISEDEMFNVINGIKNLYEMKFEQLSEAYKKFIVASTTK